MKEKQCKNIGKIFPFNVSIRTKYLAIFSLTESLRLSKNNLSRLAKSLHFPKNKIWVPFTPCRIVSLYKAKTRFRQTGKLVAWDQNELSTNCCENLALCRGRSHTPSFERLGLLSRLILFPHLSTSLDIDMTLFYKTLRRLLMLF